ncbi:Uncharacterized protein cmbei_3001410 [Cryptosporidium meleagridis]
MCANIYEKFSPRRISRITEIPGSYTTTVILTPYYSEPFSVLCFQPPAVRVSLSHKSPQSPLRQL